MSLVEAVALSKTYQSAGARVAALQGVDLSIHKGEFVALMGPSGSGKSTLLAILGALNPASGGHLSVDGIEPYALTAERRADFRSAYIGFVFQQFHLIPYLSAEENVMLPLAILRLNHSEQLRRAHQALERVGLREKARRLPNQLSGGEQERVAIARAIVNRPPLILADEPTGNLDSQSGEEIMDLFRSLNQEGLALVMVTHNPENAACAGRVVHLRDGRVEREVPGGSMVRCPPGEETKATGSRVFCLADPEGEG